jgi:CRISPR-associated protein Cmr3
VKANPNADFSWKAFSQDDLLKVAVAGAFPVHAGRLYFPAPADCACHKDTKEILRATPQEIVAGGGTDLPDGLKPVMLTTDQAKEDFKSETPPAWWPLEKYIDWLTKAENRREPAWLDSHFLQEPKRTERDHVKLNPETGASEEGQIFSTTGLNVGYLPRQGGEKSAKFGELWADVSLSVRVGSSHPSIGDPATIHLWHPLGGERRMAHWQKCKQVPAGWECPPEVGTALKNATNIRLILATPAIFKNGWKPDLDNGLLKNFKLQLVGVCIHRWKAVSGWDLVKRGPKPIRRMVSAGSVYFFTCEQGAAAKLADHWLESVTDHEQEQRDGFGLAIWGTW